MRWGSLARVKTKEGAVGAPGMMPSNPQLDKISDANAAAVARIEAFREEHRRGEATFRDLSLIHI